MNRSLKEHIPAGKLNWPRLCRELRNFHIKMMEKVYYDQYIPNRIKMQRLQTRNRMIRYRQLVMKFDELSAVNKKIKRSNMSIYWGL